MSIYSKLPIYNDIFFLLKDLYERIPKFSKQYKYLLGEKMLDCCIESLMCVKEISSVSDKEKRVVLISKTEDYLNRLLMYVRITNELHQLGGENAYFFLSEKILKILDQAENWKKFLQKRNCPQNCLSVDKQAREKECHLPLPNFFEFNEKDRG
ncbi:MAG: four helix bundle protein [Candidatus Paceibacterota bacterium]|jgi:hypothetical protein